MSCFTRISRFYRAGHDLHLNCRICIFFTWCRWNRLQNLLEQGRKDRDFSTKDALQPVMRLLLSPEGEELQVLVIEESIYVIEAIILSSAFDAYKSIPDYLWRPHFIGNMTAPTLRDGELERMSNLRDQVFRIWNLLQTSENFDQTLLLPILQVKLPLFP